jgi:hypothetical protein
MVDIMLSVHCGSMLQYAHTLKVLSPILIHFILLSLYPSMIKKCHLNVRANLLQKYLEDHGFTVFLCDAMGAGVNYRNEISSYVSSLFYSLHSFSFLLFFSLNLKQERFYMPRNDTLHEQAMVHVKRMRI